MNNRIRLIEVKKEASRLQSRENKKYTRKELETLAKAAGIMYYYTFKKDVLAEKLGL